MSRDIEAPTIYPLRLERVYATVRPDQHVRLLAEWQAAEAALREALAARQRADAQWWAAQDRVSQMVEIRDAAREALRKAVEGGGGEDE